MSLFLIGDGGSFFGWGIIIYFFFDRGWGFVYFHLQVFDAGRGDVGQEGLAEGLPVDAEQARLPRGTV